MTTSYINHRIYKKETLFEAGYNCFNKTHNCSIFIDWWSMAQLAAQDYFSRLQASGMGQFAHPDLAAAFPGGLAGLGNLNAGASSNNSSNNSSKSNSKSSRKEKRNSGGSNIPNALNIGNNLNNTTANLLGLGSATTITPTSTSSSGMNSGNSSYKVRALQQHFISSFSS